jgi:arylsulfatase A-like enzyme
MPRPATATERHFERLPGFLRTSESRKRWQSRFANEESFQETIREYYRLVSGVDVSIGAIVDRLAALGQLDNTLIVFSSDNGFMFGEHGLADKWWMFEESIRVPLLICPPRALGAPVGRMVHATTLNIDIHPTLLSAFGKPIPPACQGTSIWPVIEGKAESIRDDFYYEFFFDHPTIGKSEGVRTKEWKYIAWPGQHEHEEMLFNLIEDPQEETDLAGDSHYAERKAELRQRMLTLKHALDP